MYVHTYTHREMHTYREMCTHKETNTHIHTPQRNVYTLRNACAHIHTERNVHTQRNEHTHTRAVFSWVTQKKAAAHFSLQIAVQVIASNSLGYKHRVAGPRGSFSSKLLEISVSRNGFAICRSHEGSVLPASPPNLVFHFALFLNYR